MRMPKLVELSLSS
ncbi:hypothetical protein F383_11078 [Gossypium arboreum]|uniref:Uncharacterized protein n=1 Tax=Gossypium arboreum TaxID=29729 RepID=A0A0B0PLQ3_GOSAR|nr:hypothetical protein F383_11078 [Gossypium arboreum]